MSKKPYFFIYINNLFFIIVCIGVINNFRDSILKISDFEINLAKNGPKK